ncbi:MAG: signal recognition particle-docking protein FtsY [Bdellovibrionota bacterium]
MQKNILEKFNQFNFNEFLQNLLSYIDSSENQIDIACIFLIIFAFIFILKRKPDKQIEHASGKKEAEDRKAIVYDKLSKSRVSLLTKINNIFSSHSEKKEILEDLEELLILSDVGAKVSALLCKELSEEFKTINSESKEEILLSLKSKIENILGEDKEIELVEGETKIIMVVGVNGVGKTTTIAKLADKWIKQGKKVLLVAGDTFRAAATEQLVFWGEKVGAEVVKGKENDKPSTVVFDAMKRLKSEAFDVVIVDTAGRLHNKANLMQELSGIQNAIKKNIEKGVDEVLLVVDGTSGQNALSQAKEFNNVVGLTGIIITKLDGTPKGGILIAIKKALNIPIYFIGIGEKQEDLVRFNAKEFASALLENKES